MEIECLDALSTHLSADASAGSGICSQQGAGPDNKLRPAIAFYIPNRVSVAGAPGIREDSKSPEAHTG